MKRKFKLFLKIGFPTICFSLGIWQLYRLEKKKQMLNEINNCLSSSTKLNLLDTAIYQPYTKYYINKRDFDIQENVLVGPRGSNSLFKKMPNDSPFAYILISSIQLSDGRHVMLNRGLIPFSKNNPLSHSRFVDPLREDLKNDREEMEQINENENEDYIVILDPSNEKKNFFKRDNYPLENKWYRKDIQELSNHLHTLPLMFKVIKSGNKESCIAIPPIKIEISNRHLEYVFTWFGIGIGTILISTL